MSLPPHGSNPSHLYTALDLVQPKKIIDFSVNLNPLGPPKQIADKWDQWFSYIQDYPDPYVKELVQLIAQKEDLPQDYLLVGNGASELITLTARYLAGKKVLIIHPAFSEYETACHSEGCFVEHHLLYESDWQLNLESIEKKLQQFDAVFLCHPNNPTGVAYDRSKVEQFIALCGHSRTLCIIDEAFYDFMEEPESFIQEVVKGHVLVLRSLTKMYSIAGLRLGYVAGHPSLLQEIRKTQPHWSVNALALQAGLVCLEESEHASNTRAYLSAERRRLFEAIKRLDYQLSPSKVNFYLLKDSSQDSQYGLFLYLLKQGIVSRHTYNFPSLDGNWLRLAIKRRTENDKLLEALTAWRKGS